MRFAKLAIVLLALSVLAAAQAPVNVPVAVTDSAGKPVTDLTKDDFVIERGGQAAALSTPVAAQPAAPGKVTAAETRGLVVLVLDTIHTRYVDEREIRQQLLTYLQTAAQKQQPVSLFVLSPKGLNPVHEFTAGSAVLAAALDRADAELHKRPATGAVSPEVDAEARRLVEFARGADANLLQPDQLIRANIDGVLDMFRVLGQSVAFLPGRKSLVWITNTMPFAVDTKTHLIAAPFQYSRGAALGGPGVGGADAAGNFARGATGSSGGGMAGRQTLLSDKQLKALYPVWKSALGALFRGGMALVTVEARGSSTAATSSETVATMEALAAMTGGREVHGSNVPLAQLQDLGAVNAAAYDLSVAPAACRGEWCDLHVTLKRAGLRVAAPEGYFPPDPAELKDTRARELASALASPLEFDAVKFDVKSAGEEGTPGRKKVNFVVLLAAEVVSADGEVDLEIAARAYTPDGKTAQRALQTAATRLPPEALAQIRRDGLAVNYVIELPPGEYAVKFLVRDNLKNRMGSVTVPLKVS